MTSTNVLTLVITFLNLCRIYIFLVLEIRARLFRKMSVRWEEAYIYELEQFPVDLDHRRNLSVTELESTCTR